jgi:hypothetical protein
LTILTWPLSDMALPPDLEAWLNTSAIQLGRWNNLEYFMRLKHVRSKKNRNSPQNHQLDMMVSPWFNPF